MRELSKLRGLLDELLIGYEVVGECISLTTKPVVINENADGLLIDGWGFCNIWSWSAEYVARMLDRKFKTEMCKGCQFEKSCTAAMVGW